LISDKHRFVLWLIPVIAGAILALYPYWLNHVPYGTDEWGLLRNAEQILTQSPVRLGALPQFDDYNIYWPGVSILEVVFSLIFRTVPLSTVPVVVLASSVLTTSAFFLLIERLTKSGATASIASILLVTAGFFITSAASATKQTVAFSFFTLALLLFLRQDTGWKKNLILFSLTTAALALTHHVTMLLLFTVVLSASLVEYLIKFRSQIPTTRNYLFFFVVGVIFLSYYEFYSKPGWKNIFPLGSSDIVSIIAFWALAMGPLIYYSLARPVKLGQVYAVIVLLTGAIAAVLFLGTRAPLVAGAPIVDSGILLLASSYLATSVIAMLGYYLMQSKMGRLSFAFLGSWMAAIFALVCYMLFASTVGIFVFRLFIFLYPALAAFSAVALVKYLGASGRPSMNMIKKVVLVAVILGISSLSAYQSYAAIVLGNNLLGGHWTYRGSDLSGERWTQTYLQSDSQVAGDTHISYLFGSYGGINVTGPSISTYAYLTGLSSNEPTLLATYSLMGVDGYVIVADGLPLPQNWITRLENMSSITYDNGNIVLWNQA
jgi:hypothetical protein